jgi:hypothetical protein
MPDDGMQPVKSADELKLCSDFGCDRDGLAILVVWHTTG